MIGVALLPVILAAQPCIDRLRSISPDCTTEGTCANEIDACTALALDAQAKIQRAHRREKVPEPRPRAEDVQPGRPAPSAGLACVPEIGTARIETVGTGGGCVQFTGTDRGRVPTLSMTINPLGLATLDDAEAFARAARVTNLTLLLPAAAREGEIPSFIGLRATVDATGFRNGRLAYQRVTEAYKAALAAQGALVDRLMAALVDEGRKNDPACLDAIQRASEPAIAGACGVEIASEAKNVELARARVREELGTIRAEADRRHAGLRVEADVPLDRADVPDLPLRLAAQLQGALRAGEAGWRWGVSGGVGASYVKPTDVDGTTAFTWSIAATADVNVAETSAHLSLGFSGNVGEKLDEAAAIGALNPRTGHWVDVEAVISVPLSSGTGVTASVSWPATREDELRGPTFSIALDGAFLLGGPAGGAGGR